MSDYWLGWLEYSTRVQVQLIGAEIRRMQRTDDETAILYRRLACQRVRYILGRLIRR